MRHRNERLVDGWSFVHLATGIAFGWVMSPAWALLIMIAWEPLELFVLSPLAWKLWRKEFGHEGLANSWSDIMFDGAGVALGAFVLRDLVAPPFTLF